jgi:hypothetical protein
MDRADRANKRSRVKDDAGGGKSMRQGSCQQKVMVEVVSKATVGGVHHRPGWCQVELENLDGKGIHLLVAAQATVLQLKRCVATEDGTPVFQQHLWAEGAELLNGNTAAESGLLEGSKISLVKGEAASWQLVVLSEPDLFDCLGNFLALSKWREKGGYEEAGKTMQIRVSD